MQYLFAINHDKTNANYLGNRLFSYVPNLTFWQFASTLGLRIFYVVVYNLTSVSLEQLEIITELGLKLKLELP